MELLAIVGPTAVGKTAVAIELAQRLNGELVSADAVAVYRRLDIGSAKPSAAEQALARFHLIDVVDPTDDFTLADFTQLAERAFAEIRARGRLPILVGGTGLYVRAVTATLTVPAVAPQPELRATLWADAERDGSPELHARLAAVDPISAEKILLNDAKKIIRALEVFMVTGKPLSDFHTPEGVHGVPKPGVTIFGLDLERAELYKRIDQRVDAMLSAGFVDEVRQLRHDNVPDTCKSMGSLGYRHLVQFMRNERSYDDAIEELKRDTRRYAKRQLTWFRGDPQVRWLSVGENESAQSVAGRLILELEGNSE